ncbi:hypothetical protein GOP47_0013842 [Adiantum capillus-veneris]|uniref:VPS9 domain-containing protein n=1 Tax=Adiantum capillus-veneris TaxID=13818 RepID=A0A9D4ZG59_ADICA|nr:hypothetical protein GOP47_0013842 [Adiantum capillus-veneris]
MQMETVDFHDFLDRMRNPAAADLVRSIKSFIIELSSRPPNPEIDSKSVQEFMATMEGTFKGHPLWAGATQEELENAGEGLEKYLMTKLYSRTFASVPEEVEHDQRVYEKMHLLQQFIRPEHLDIPPKFQNETSWLLAQKDIQKINTYKNPRDKIQCILSCSTVILNVSMAADENPPGADEFLPVLIYVIIKANPPQLYSNLLFIQRYRHQSRLVSEAAYFFTNLVSAESFIGNLDAASISMDEKEFQRKMMLAKESFDAMTSLPRALDVLPEQVHSQPTENLEVQTMLVGGSATSPKENKMSVENLQTSGSLAVLQADKAGLLAREYPFLYATVGDLRVEDVESLLNDYKELVLKYYALHKSVEKLTLEQSAGSVGKSRGASDDTGWEERHEVAAEHPAAAKDMVDDKRVPETEDAKELLENSARLIQGNSASSGDEMADKNVILVNES